MFEDTIGTGNSKRLLRHAALGAPPATAPHTNFSSQSHTGDLKQRTSERNGVTIMSWSEMPFGKYVGKTLPQILLQDLDYFNWVQPKLYGPLASEARDLRRKATSIRVPERKGNRRLVQFYFE